MTLLTYCAIGAAYTIFLTLLDIIEKQPKSTGLNMVEGIFWPVGVCLNLLDVLDWIIRKAFGVK